MKMKLTMYFLKIRTNHGVQVAKYLPVLKLGRYYESIKSPNSQFVDWKKFSLVFIMLLIS